MYSSLTRLENYINQTMSKVHYLLFLTIIGFFLIISTLIFLSEYKGGYLLKPSVSDTQIQEKLII